MKRYPTTLIIAGSDSCGGAGIQADIKTCSAIGVYATTAITAITAQNTMGVRDIQAVTPHMVKEQITAILQDFVIDSIKIGMLCNAAIATTVADVLQDIKIPIVLDPVMASTSGHQLLSNDAIEVIVKKIFPLADVITPNAHEATLLTNIKIDNEEDVSRAGHILLEKGCRAVLIKGGHLSSHEATDYLYCNNTLRNTFSAPFIDTRNTHGTGCTLSSAIAAYRALGYDLYESITRAKEYVYQAITHGADVHAGHGHGSLNHGFAPQSMSLIDL